MRQESPREVCSAFSSQLGWMAAVWGEQGLKRLVFGYRSRNAALQGAGRQQSCGVLDEKMAGLVERLCQFAGGQEDDFQDVSVDLSQRTVFQRLCCKSAVRLSGDTCLATATWHLARISAGSARRGTRHVDQPSLADHPVSPCCGGGWRVGWLLRT